MGPSAILRHFMCYYFVSYLEISLNKSTFPLFQYLKEMDHDSHMSKQVSTLEKTIALQEKVRSSQTTTSVACIYVLPLIDESMCITLFYFQARLQKVQHRKKTIKQLNRQAAKKAEETALLDPQIANMHVDVAEMRHVYEATGNLTIISQYY